MSRRASRPDAGFTLIETIVVVALMGLVMTVMASTTVVILRTSPQTTRNIDDARSIRGLSTWLSQDVMSTYAIDVTGDVTAPWSAPSSIYGFDTHPENPGLCGSVVGTVNIVQMAWKRTTTTTRVFVANYRFDPSASDASVIRITCEGASTSTLAATSRTELTAGLAIAQDFPEVADYDAAGNELVVRLASDSGNEVLIEVASRNPATP